MQNMYCFKFENVLKTSHGECFNEFKTWNMNSTADAIKLHLLPFLFARRWTWA
jgi:hypothetical protein